MPRGDLCGPATIGVETADPIVLTTKAKTTDPSQTTLPKPLALEIGSPTSSLQPS
jgi:hypothetical protein